jgi:hypothetical protein
MNDQYLWDRSGEPDPEIQRLEEILGTLRSHRPAPQLRARPSRIELLDGSRWLAVAAAVVLMAGASWLTSRPAQITWQVARMAGAPMIGANRIQRTGAWAAGQWLETDTASRARIDVGKIGFVEVDPNSRLRLIAARAADHRLALARGTIHAMIWAPPRLFSVETPSAVAVDLGCAYTLTVDDSGATLLHVTAGWVGFERDGRESFVPAGAACVSKANSRPGTPFFVDASETFKSALAKLDFDRDPRALNLVLAEARPRDAFTLWHLLTKVDPTDEARVYNKLASLVPPPAGVTLDVVSHGDKRALDLWWNELGLGDASWWRMWKGPDPLESK